MFNHKFTRFLISIFVDFPIGVQYDYKKEETSDELSVADDHSDDFSLLEIDLRAEEEVTWGLSASMPEYVYALHDFTPENEDEIQFSAGDRIEVIEKDEVYQDGWWQGRNLIGKVGLFPQGYTTSDLSVFQPQNAPQADDHRPNGSNSLSANELQSLAKESDEESGREGEREGVTCGS